MPMIISCGDGRTWLFHTELEHGRWAKWTASASDGIHVTSICEPSDKTPGYYWDTRQRMPIGVPGMIAFSLAAQPTLEFLRANLPAKWEQLWTAVEVEYAQVAKQLRRATIRTNSIAER
ncbi:hypothetical protein AB0E01_22580 [Nocardia vinacea]|uniref:hypothetical protein n=1 Tax=Nocardia vinacea TaxID=96468 RepID=UPI0034113B28